MSLNIKIIVNYANTLFVSLNEKNQHQTGLDDLSKFFSIIKESNKLNDLLNSPVVDFQEKEKALNVVFKAIQLNKAIQSFLCILVKNTRIELLKDIILEYKSLIDKKNNLKQVKVISSSKLSESDFDYIKNSIKSDLKIDVECEHEIDARLIGGIVINYDNKIIDFSIAGALDKLKKIEINA